MTWVERCRTKARHVCHKVCCIGPLSAKASGVDVEGGMGKHKQQYRLESSHGNRSWLNFLSCRLLGRNQRHSGHMTVGINPNQQMALYLHWMFRVNFAFLFFLMCFVFFVLVVVFAGLIVVAGSINPDCVRVGGRSFGETGYEFSDAFTLSWTTFSTVVRVTERHLLGSLHSRLSCTRI
jgi:hypothetical protein